MIVNKVYFKGGRNGKCVVCGILLKDEEREERPFHRCPLHPNCRIMICSQCLERNWNHVDITVNTNIFNNS